MCKNIGIIDCGTNTFHLLIAEVSENSCRVLYKEKVAVKIGKDGISTDLIHPEAEERALEAFLYFKEVASSHGIDQIQATATSAFRNAKNGQKVANSLYAKTNIPVSIIDGRAEASLIHRGVCLALTPSKKGSLIMDIGGGSVEFILTKGEEVLWLESFEIGAQRLLDRFHHDEPISSIRLKELEAFVIEALGPLKKVCDTYKPEELIGASGTFDTFSDIYREKFDLTKSYNATELPFSPEFFYDIYEMMIAKTREERIRIPGMMAMRADMIVVASALVNTVLKITGLKDIRVAAYALKEGLLDQEQKKMFLGSKC
ncbi:MAG: exopolyphosphatase [Cyclobacteriaceae bacterium]|nr:exopolyphosphatase [Cyclobacteriaceae bacterium]